MDAAGKKYLQFRAIDSAGGDFRHERIDRGAPQDQRAERADVATAFSPFEDEAACPFLQEQREQLRRRDMQQV